MLGRLRGIRDMLRDIGRDAADDCEVHPGDARSGDELHPVRTANAEWPALRSRLSPIYREMGDAVRAGGAPPKSPLAIAMAGRRKELEKRLGPLPDLREPPEHLARIAELDDAEFAAFLDDVATLFAAERAEPWKGLLAEADDPALAFHPARLLPPPKDRALYSRSARFSRAQATRVLDFFLTRVPPYDHLMSRYAGPAMSTELAFALADSLAGDPGRLDLLKGSVRSFLSDPYVILHCALSERPLPRPEAEQRRG